MVFDDETLIMHVEQRPWLYDTTRSDFRDAARRDNAWKWIDAAMGKTRLFDPFLSPLLSHCNNDIEAPRPLFLRPRTPGVRCQALRKCLGSWKGLLSSRVFTFQFAVCFTYYCRIIDADFYAWLTQGRVQTRFPWKSDYSKRQLNSDLKPPGASAVRTMIRSTSRYVR